MLQCFMSIINGALQRTRLSFTLGVDTNARPIVRLVQMIDPSLSLMLQRSMSVIVVPLQREFLTHLSFALGVNVNA